MKMHLDKNCRKFYVHAYRINKFIEKNQNFRVLIESLLKYAYFLRIFALLECSATKFRANSDSALPKTKANV